MEQIKRCLSYQYKVSQGLNSGEPGSEGPLAPLLRGIAGTGLTTPRRITPSTYYNQQNYETLLNHLSTYSTWKP